MKPLDTRIQILVLAIALVVSGCGGAGGAATTPAGGGSSIVLGTLCEALDPALVQKIGTAKGDPKTYNDQDREASCTVMVDTDDGVGQIKVDVFKPDAFDGATGSALLAQAPGAREVESWDGVGDEALVADQYSGPAIYFRVGEEVFRVSVPDGHEETAVEIAQNVVANASA